jgi:hypothetical protein
LQGVLDPICGLRDAHFGDTCYGPDERVLKGRDFAAGHLDLDARDRPNRLLLSRAVV